MVHDCSMRTSRRITALAILALLAAVHSSAAQKPTSLPAPNHPAVSVLLPAPASDTDVLGYPLRRIDRLAVRRLLVAGSFDALETLLAAYDDSAARDYRLELRLFDAYGAFASCVPPLAPLLDQWVQQRPSSGAALLARANFLLACGWRARGGAYAKDTPDQQLALMGQLFRAALNDLGQAQTLAPNSLVGYDDLMNIARVKGDVALSRRYLEQGLKVQPYSFVLRAEYMSVLLPRWGGSYEAMDDFVAESAPYAAMNPRIRTLQGFADWDRARLLLDSNANVQAEQEFQQALRYGDLPRFLFERGRFFGRTGRYRDALADLNSALTHNPQQHDALFERARVEYALGGDAPDSARAQFYAQALEDIELAVKLDPTEYRYQDLLARYHLTIAAVPAARVVIRKGWSSAPVSSPTLDARMRETVTQSAARTPRTAFYDIAYPQDSTELAQMNGYAILLVTAVVRDSAEIPLARVYVRTSDGEHTLWPIATVASPVSPANFGLVPLGSFRVDGVYLFPVAARISPGDMLVDFAAHRQGQALERLDGSIGLPSWLAGAARPAGPPAPSALWEMVRREDPDLAPLLASGEQ